jgi:hypothetical protein
VWRNYTESASSILVGLPYLLRPMQREFHTARVWFQPEQS